MTDKYMLDLDPSLNSQCKSM